jgi:hypothetical protein
MVGSLATKERARQIGPFTKLLPTRVIVCLLFLQKGIRDHADCQRAFADTATAHDNQLVLTRRHSGVAARGIDIAKRISVQARYAEEKILSCPNRANSGRQQCRTCMKLASVVMRRQRGCRAKDDRRIDECAQQMLGR